MKTPTELRNEKLGATVVKNLESRRFEAMYVSTGKEAVKQILSTIPRESKKTIEAQYAP